MSKCLSDARIRAAADDEAKEFERQHLEACGECRARLSAARRASEEFTTMAASVAVPAALRDGVERALTRREGSIDRAGATTLRDVSAPRWNARLWLTAGVVAVPVLVIIFIVALPPLDAPRALSAAQILDRSLQTLSPASGTELRDFDLELQLPRIASVQNGTYRIEQLVDHDTPGRYRLVRYAPDGTLLAAIGEEPAAGRRIAIVRVDDQLFAFRFTIDPGRTLGLRDLERHHVEAMIRVLQAAAGQTVREVDAGGGKRYLVELPQVADAGASGLWELSRARVVVDAADFQILELAAAGSYMGESFSVSFRLRRRHVRPSAEVPPDQFEVPNVAEAISIEGAGTDDLAHDLLVSALRELARSRR
ncbi:MAG: hypothetical protein ACRD09_05645 [Vicinamibacterales bacterium]